MDKIFHVCIYTSISFFLCHFLPIFVAPVIAIGIGLFEEYLLQKSIKGRTTDFKDLVADAVGIIIGVLIYYFMCKGN